MAITAYPNIPFSQSSTFSYDQRIIESQFGDGYSQRVADGLNSYMMSANISHDNLTQAEFNTLLTFWNTVGRVTPFTITDPTTGVTTKVRFTEPFQVTALSGNLYSVSAVVKQTYDLVS